MTLRAVLLALLCTPLLQAQEAAPAIECGRSVTSTRGAVACVERNAARIGAQVLADGGNAVDAAVAVAFALAVTYPAAGNLGGGGFMLVALADGRTAAIDYRETAPAAADARLFLDARGRIDRSKSESGHFVVGVPGTVAGLEEAHRRFGTRPWAELVEPARRLAADGIEVDAVLADGLARNAAALGRFAGSAACFLHEDGRPYAVGERLVQADLANSLRWIAAGGAKAFYEGPIAALIAAEMARAGAPMVARDLASYRPVVREVLRARYRDFDLILMPPPSSGGVALAEMLGVLEPFELRKGGGFTADARHRIAEAQRRAFADRAQFLGDPDATAIPLDRLLSKEHFDELRRSIDADRATPSEKLGPPLTGTEEDSTTHFSIVDGGGSAVANTYTIEDWFGSRLVAPGTGFLLNDELHDFNLKPGLTDRAGHVGTEPNVVRPGRRPLSSMTPCIVQRGGRTVLVTGSPGGRSIINTVATVVLAVCEFGASLEDALATPRQHHAWFPDVLRIEAGVDAATRAELERRGHALEVAAEPQGDAHSIACDPATGSAHAVADRRIDGWAAAPATPPAKAPGAAPGGR
jgi:gamma-glutamyltranspeptidase/glutathione hydrolase